MRPFTFIINPFEIDKLWIDFEFICSITYLFVEIIWNLLGLDYHRCGFPLFKYCFRFSILIVDNLSFNHLGAFIPLCKWIEHILRDNQKVLVIQHFFKPEFMVRLYKTCIINHMNFLLLNHK